MKQQYCPCRDCEMRSMLCHAQCEKYHTWAAEMKREKHKAWQAASGRRDAKMRVIDCCIAERRKKALK